MNSTHDDEPAPTTHSRKLKGECGQRTEDKFDQVLEENGRLNVSLALCTPWPPPVHHPRTNQATGNQVVIQRHLLQVACIGVGAIVGCAEAVIGTALAEWCVKWAAPPAKGLNPALNA